MTKADVLAGARGKPVPFETGDAKFLLRPLSVGERRELFDWYKEHQVNADSGLELQRKLILAAVADESGKALLDAADLNEFAVEIADELAKEIARRNGFGADAGKA